MFINPLQNEKSPKRKCASGLMILERETGLEPATSTLARWHSTTELLPQVVKELLGTRGISSLRLLGCQGRFRSWQTAEPHAEPPYPASLANHDRGRGRAGRRHRARLRGRRDSDEGR